MRFVYLLVPLVVGLFPASGTSFSVSATGPQLPDNNAAGVNVDFVFNDPGIFINAAGNNVTFTLTNFSHTWAGDITATLTHVDSGLSTTIMNRPGGGTFGSSADFSTANTYSFNDGFPNPIQSLPSVPSPIPSTNFSPALPFAVFNGDSVSGTWRLNIADNAAGDTSNANWTGTLTLEGDVATSIPEPVTSMTVLFGSLAVLGVRRLRNRSRQFGN
jgi:hypothetical protein